MCLHNEEGTRKTHGHPFTWWQRRQERCSDQMRLLQPHRPQGKSKQLLTLQDAEKSTGSRLGFRKCRALPSPLLGQLPWKCCYKVLLIS